MPENSSTVDTMVPNEDRAFRVTMMHHPTLHVTDLDVAEKWFERVFGCSSVSIGAVLSNLTVRPDWPRDYSIYTPIRDVFFDTLDPNRFVISGNRRYGEITKPHLKEFGWCVEGAAPAFRAIKRHGLVLTNSLGEVVVGDNPPTGPNDPAPFYTLREQTGLRYRFYPAEPFPFDVRSEPGWTLPPVSDSDPLGVDFCSHHTILTSQGERALEIVVGVLGGEILHRGRDDLRGLTSTYVYLGNTILDYAVPDPGTAADDDWAEQDKADTYHALTWKVVDLDRTERQLLANGVRIRDRSGDTIVTDPESSLGVPWGFTTRLIPGDPRARR